ncbi:MAG: glycosyltransferase family 2 protein [Verrucomicrobiales bacterium]
MASPDPHRLVLIPSYNTGPRVLETVRRALTRWEPVWVVVDGSTDGTTELLQAEAAREPHLHVFVLPRNSGKGAALLHGLQEARRLGFTHALAMDADGQHPAESILDFMALSCDHPDAVILGRPVFDVSVPAERLFGRRISNFWANLETLWLGIEDSLFGFRVYPIEPLVQIMKHTRFMRHFDFDPEAAVRLVWAGHRPLCLPAPCRYFSPAEGGVSHFHYLRTNTVLAWMHARLVVGALLRLPRLFRLRRLWRTANE